MKKIIIFLTVLILFGGVFYKVSFAPDKRGQEPLISSTSTSSDLSNASSSTEKEIGDTIKVGGIEYKNLEEKLVKPNIPAPSLDKPLIFPERMSAEVKKTTEDRINALISTLEKDPLSFDSWNNLALERQGIDDYEGAKEIWVYTSALSPKNPLSSSNLGNLYGYYLKDNIKAEENYLKSIELEKNNGFWYYQAFMFYKDALKDDIKAKAIIEEGVKNNPTDEDLKNILNSL